MTTVTRNAGSVINGGSWTSAADALTPDDACASESVTATSNSSVIILGNFGFDAFLPSSASIITVQYRVRGTAINPGSVSWHPILVGVGNLVKSQNASFTAQSSAGISPYWTSLSQGTLTNMPWTRNDLLNANFSFQIYGEEYSDWDTTFYLDAVEVVVDYTINADGITLLASGVGI